MQRAANDDEESKRTNEIQQQQSTVVREEHEALKRAEQNMNGRLRDLAWNRAVLAAEEQKERAEGVRAVQQGFLANELTRHSISSASINGIGPAMTANLAAAGSGTAADFTGVSMSGGGYYGNPIALIVRSTGGGVRVSASDPRKLRLFRNGARGSRIARGLEHPVRFRKLSRNGFNGNLLASSSSSVWRSRKRDGQRSKKPIESVQTHSRSRRSSEPSSSRRACRPCNAGRTSINSLCRRTPSETSKPGRLPERIVRWMRTAMSRFAGSLLRPFGSNGSGIDD